MFDISDYSLFFGTIIDVVGDIEHIRILDIEEYKEERENNAKDW
jgi:hypothetical protein